MFKYFSLYIRVVYVLGEKIKTKEGFLPPQDFSLYGNILMYSQASFRIPREGVPGDLGELGKDLWKKQLRSLVWKNKWNLATADQSLFKMLCCRYRRDHIISGWRAKKQTRQA